jgi:hypothetical protein
MTRLGPINRILVAKVVFMLVFLGATAAWPRSEPVFFNLFSEQMRGKDLYTAHTQAILAINQLLEHKPDRQTQKYGPLVSDFGFSSVSETERDSLAAMVKEIDRYFMLTGQKTILHAHSREVIESECLRQEKECEYIRYVYNSSLYDGGEDPITQLRKTTASYLFIAGQNQSGWNQAEYPPAAHAVCQSLNPQLAAISFLDYLQGKKIEVQPYRYPLDARNPFDLVVVLQLPITAIEKTVTFETITTLSQEPYQALVIGLDVPEVNRLSVNGLYLSDSDFLSADIS